MEEDKYDMFDKEHLERENERIKISYVTIYYKDLFSDDILVRQHLPREILIVTTKALIKDLLGREFEDKEQIKKELLEIIKE